MINLKLERKPLFSEFPFLFLFVGWAICDYDVIAISRLRGRQLKTLDIPHCCILTLADDEDWAFSFGFTNEQFNNEVLRSCSIFCKIFILSDTSLQLKDLEQLRPKNMELAMVF